MQLQLVSYDSQPSRPGPLQKWRLRRVVEYVDSHLGERIMLSDLAAAAGLTRMHFAAQFRVAMGIRPHHYVLRRRIDHACALLRDPELPLVEVALAVGFQTQAHFTTVFKRYVGATPHRWRRCEAALLGEPMRKAANFALEHARAPISAANG
ncbi:MAG: helix-turn-helix transcriptional regulator [Alphaproteobacteria bacterium]|nr:helix-turn-helix transcriptional regulator [Alphaproteobacteria bacterium]MBV8408852.1 helix-turn-helix transcriptional regulator [Alphaproteobacteria bacterium]